MKSYKIFIIDDDESVIEVLSEYLAFSDFQVYSNTDPKKALEDVSVIKPDVILCDINMPGMTGLDVLKKIREDKNLSDIIFILLTSLDKVDIKVKGLEAGADDYITKPFSKTEVLARIRTIIRRARSSSDTLKGDLTTLTLEEVLQIFDINKKSGIIRFEEIDGEVQIKDGSFTLIRFGDIYDFDALIRLLLHNYGGFRITFVNKNLDGSPKATVSDYLFSAVTYLDELRKNLSPDFKETDRILITDEEMAKFFGTKDITLIDALSFMKGDLKENLELLKEKLKNQQIKIKD